ncbi:hypothetical protein ACFXKG_00965 [Streptomyces sp. NPDC059255]|uniref:hypothetical protein n=1 Tax=Streptomyces sp. NPDC059255 TaxID=3346793 RepID=UPI00367D7A2F
MDGGALVDADARTAMTKDDHRQAVTVFTGALLADFDRYLSHEESDPVRDGVLYRQGAVCLTGDEFTALVEELEAVVARHTRTAPGGGRTRHTVSLTLVPDTPPAPPGPSRR